jgi:hypothetical protein
MNRLVSNIMPIQLRDPKLRCADFAVSLIATTAEHVRDCQRCYEILVRGIGEKFYEEIAALRGAPSALTQGFQLAITPSKLWPLLSESYPAFVRCEHWPGVAMPN